MAYSITASIVHRVLLCVSALYERLLLCNQCYTYIKIKSTACPLYIANILFTTSVKCININIL